MTKGLVLGIVADDALQTRDLKAFSGHFSYKVQVACSPAQWLNYSQESLQNISCWLIDFDVDEDRHSELIRYLDQCDVPVIYGIEAFSQSGPGREQEFRRLQTKLISALDELYLDTAIAMTEVWVLGASLGGPEAVKQFIDALPESLNAILLYAQHIDEIGSRALVDVLGRDSKLPVHTMDDITLLCPGRIYTVPIDSMIDFSQRFAYKTRRPWPGGYKPSINELLTIAHKQFDERLNVIFFSGMGEDGADKAMKMKARDAQVWAQSVETCVSPAMPVSVIEKNICQQVASPVDLAKALTKRLKSQEP
jgi:chemosensory pili system protein ChpB (putative protein-glutamate methylesterase)